MAYKLASSALDKLDFKDISQTCLYTWIHALINSTVKSNNL